MLFHPTVLCPSFKSIAFSTSLPFGLPDLGYTAELPINSNFGMRVSVPTSRSRSRHRRRGVGADLDIQCHPRLHWKNDRRRFGCRGCGFRADAGGCCGEGVFWEGRLGMWGNLWRCHGCYCGNFSVIASWI